MLCVNTESEPWLEIYACTHRDDRVIALGYGAVGQGHRVADALPVDRGGQAQVFRDIDIEFGNDLLVHVAGGRNGQSEAVACGQCDVTGDVLEVGLESLVTSLGARSAHW